MWRAVLVAMGATAASIGCFAGDTCEGIGTCEAPPEVPSCEGVCAPFVSALWAPVLVASSRAEQPRCPSVAPFEAMSTASILACGVQEGEGVCESDELVCLRGAPGWVPCVVRDGAQACPPFYEISVDAAEGITLCCPNEEPPG